MRIATWNVNGLRARLAFVVRWLRERRPDLVAFQELKLSDEQFPHEELAAEGYRAVAFGQKSWNGVAVLARGPLALVSRGLPGQEAMGARLLTARAGGLELSSVYVPNGKDTDHEDFGRKLAWLDALAAHVEASGAAGRAAVLGGDFNVCPTALDTWDEASHAGAIFHTPEERARFARLEALGFVDLFRRAHPTLQAFSWWDYRGGAFHRRHGLRIDFLLASPSAAERIREVSIDRDWRKKQDELTPSDHAPVWADLAD